MKKYLQIEKDLLLGPLKEGSAIRLNNIWVKTNKYNVKPGSCHELNRLIAVMNEHESMYIELSGHTGNEGQFAYNQSLSEHRAREVITICCRISRQNA